MATNNNNITSDAELQPNIILKLWDQLNDALEYVPKFQNKDQLGVDEESIQYIESKLGVRLPKEIRDVVKVHDGRDHINYGFTFRLATTDLLPIAKWRPYEKEGERYTDALFECLADENNMSVDKNLRDDAKQHLATCIERIKNAKQQSKNDEKEIKYELKNDEAFHALPCEILIIGEGADDYVEQYLLSIQSGRIYLAIHNLPDWTIIGTFADWINMGMKNAVKNKHIIVLKNDFSLYKVIKLSLKVYISLPIRIVDTLNIF